jgi:hypothetical protein
VWEDGLIHYIKDHNIRPREKFIDALFFNTKHSIKKSALRIKCNSAKDIEIKDGINYVKLSRNQIMIMDALMTHGGYSKRYIDKNKQVYRYSEHAGLLDFNGNHLDKVIISGNTNRVDRGDDEIFLPQNMKEAFDYEYLFHTHPPTPKPGGRVVEGIIYEFPSLGDILHFIDHYNDGKVNGSIVIAPEGLYNIRKMKMNGEQIKVNENQLFRDISKEYNTLQKKAIKKYGSKFTTYTFYSKISQDREYIDAMNNLLNRYDLHIDFYSRDKDNKGKWIINTLYLPIYK